ncbi:MAG: sulfatase [Acidobacteriota bacterium]
MIQRNGDPMMTTRPLLLAGLLSMSLLGLAGCGDRAAAPAPATSRLVDVFRPEMVTPRRAAAGDASVGADWRFDRPYPGAGPHAATHGFEAGPGVEGLAVSGGVLTGRSTTDFPLLHLATTPPAEPDVLHALEVTLSASAGSNLSVQFVPSEEPIHLDEQLGRARMMPWRISTPLVADGKMRTYVLSSPYTTEAVETRHILLRPTDAPGATFRIQSVRVVLRRDHFAAVPAGVSWQGLGEIYRETLVSRAPDVVRLPVRLGGRPWLDLAVGTVEEKPVTFRVAVETGDGGRDGKGEEVLERTVTSFNRWEPLRIDLARWAGRDVTLALSLGGSGDGALGFWGAPVVRDAVDLAQGDQPDQPEDGRPQGVIFIVTDTLRRDHLDAYGYGRDTAPNLTRLAKEGALFRDCLSEATWTKVAMPSLLTSLYPGSHGVIDFGDRLPSSAHTIAEAYRGAGYATLGLSSVFFTGRLSNLHQGFEELHESASLVTKPSSKTGREYVDRLLPWLDTHRDVPFFVFLHVLDPHFPYETYRPYDTWWADPAKKAQYQEQIGAVRPHIGEPLLRMIGMPNSSELAAAGVDAASFTQQNLDWYDGSIRSLDAEIGRLVTHLRSLGLDKRTLIAVVADHGEEFLDHGKMFHGQSVYGELTNVPLLLWDPGRIPAGTVVEQTVQNIDLMPTLLDLSGVAAPKEAQGTSLVSLLGPGVAKGGEPKPWRERPAFSEKSATVDVLGPPPRDTQSFAVTYEGWKLIFNEKRGPGVPEYELYDHRRDPLDRNDVAARNPERVQQLARLIDGWRRKVRSERLPSDAEAGKSLGNEELERLRSLGYIQ